MQGVTEMVDESLVDKELPESLHPIQAWQDRLTVVNGLSGRVAGGGHSNDFGRWAPTTAAVAWATVEWQPARPSTSR